MTLAAGDSLRQASDQQLETALPDAELPSLMPALAYLTGDMSLAGGDLRPPVTGPSVVVAPQGGMTPPPARREDQQALLTCMTGDVDDRYLPMLAFELGLPRAGTAPGAGDGDTDAPGWTKPALAPGRDFRVAVIGAGMSGLAVAYRLLQAGLGFVVFERNADVGGVWLENDYPGCRLDTSNFCYSYSFLQRDDWPHQYSLGTEIREYFQQAAGSSPPSTPAGTDPVPSRRRTSSSARR